MLLSLEFTDNTAAVLLCLFLSVLLVVIISHPKIFLKRHGRQHALTGLFYLAWILIGHYEICSQTEVIPHLVFDGMLGLLGVSLTLTAAYAFPHKHVVNVASGTLDEHATVTQGEMFEHSFYQGLNLVQILYLHSLSLHHSMPVRFALALGATLPWVARDLFPVNRFSDNYTKQDDQSTWLIRLLYRVKKYQYVFYKHFLLHGLNVSAALFDLSGLARQWAFRSYWLLLNTSYVMEFFLQTLVKKKHLSQRAMLGLQKVLMLASTVAACRVLMQISVPLSLASLVLNFIHRKHDFLNTGLILAALWLWMR